MRGADESTPLDSLEDLIQESRDSGPTRRRLGLPHPLSNFAAGTGFKDNFFADIILGFIHDTIRQGRDMVPVREREGVLFFLFCGGNRRGEAEKSLGIVPAA